MTNRTTVAALAAVLTFMFTASCRSDSDQTSHPTSAANSTPLMMANEDHMMMAHNDKDLVTMLLEHHDGALRLSDLELQKGESQDAKSMARKIKDQQTKEKQDLQKLQQQLGGAGMGMSDEMKAKQQKAEQEVSSASGHDADHAFLKHMSEHHKDGIVMLQQSMANLKNNELKQMAQKMIKDQQQDIEKMQKMMH